MTPNRRATGKIIFDELGSTGADNEEATSGTIIGLSNTSHQRDDAMLMDTVTVTFQWMEPCKANAPTVNGYDFVGQTDDNLVLKMMQTGN